MIRRDMSDSAGRPVWALISQVEHARIAGELARAWTGVAAPLAQPRDEFLAAVFRHDDGWIAWELRPTVHDGKPRDFMEMPLDESLAIWRRSIAVAHNAGPLAAYAVSAHFATLCRWSYEEKPHDHAWRHLAEEFFEEQSDLQAQYRQEFAVRGEPADLERAWHGLQFFDRASLWLCCAERTEPETLASREFATLEFAPRRTAGDGTFEIGIAPWPFAGDSLELAAPAQTIPQADYPTDEALSQALKQSADHAVSIRWRLVPG